MGNARGRTGTGGCGQDDGRRHGGESRLAVVRPELTRAGRVYVAGPEPDGVVAERGVECTVQACCAGYQCASVMGVFIPALTAAGPARSVCAAGRVYTRIEALPGKFIGSRGTELIRVASIPPGTIRTASLPDARTHAKDQPLCNQGTTERIDQVFPDLQEPGRQVFGRVREQLDRSRFRYAGLGYLERSTPRDRRRSLGSGTRLTAGR